MSLKTVTLLLPGYTTQTPLQGDDAASASHADFQFSADEQHQPWQYQLMQKAGHACNHGQSLPVARLEVSNLNQFTLPSSSTLKAGVVRADPCFLKPDRDSATLYPFNDSMITEKEADAIIAGLNAFVAEDGYCFFRRGVSEWYMAGLEAQSLQTYPPSFLASRKASSFLPDGDEAAHWRRLLTELQMLLHSLPINQQREAQGQSPVNSVWFWGGAELPVAQTDEANFCVFTDHEQARILAQSLGFSCKALSQFNAHNNELSSDQNIIVIDDSAVQAWLNQDVDALEVTLARIQAQWLEPLVRQIKAGRVGQIEIFSEDGLVGLCNVQTLSATNKDGRGSEIWSRLTRWFK